ncbi:hypothetical protein ACA910_001044 [Epithemia clementina (nom. ined.)]
MAMFFLREPTLVVALVCFTLSVKLTTAFTSHSGSTYAVGKSFVQTCRPSSVSDWRRYATDADVSDKVNNDEQADSTITKAARTTESKRENDEIFQEASEKLEAVGWSLPTSGDLTSDDPFVQAIDAGIQRDVGVSLDELLNPAKVVNLERDLYALRQELAAETGMTSALIDASSTSMTATPGRFQTTEECDGGGGGAQADQLREKIAKKEKDLAIERRSVFRGWLKTVFLVQAILSFGISYVMATNPSSLFGQFDWFYSYNMDISIQVLGYWWWWLFVVPSLRSRRPKGMEKKALDWAFLGTPMISLLAPVATKDTGAIWAANFAVVVACYAVAYLAPESDGNDGEGSSDDTPDWLKFVYKSLDFGSGRERGARK